MAHGAGAPSPAGPPRPSLVSWNTTRQCNLACSHCYRDARETADPRELTTEQGRALIADIAATGCRVLILSGGEPLVRADLLELVEAAAAAGLRPGLGTNGTLLTPAWAARLQAAGLARAAISLDSADPAYHNVLRCSPTAWQEATAGMRACREVGLPFQVNTTVTQQNEDQILRLTDFAQEMGAVGHHVFFLVPTGRGRDIAGDMVQAETIERLLEALLRRGLGAGFEIKPTCAPQFVRIAARLGIDTWQNGCLAGRSYCVITPHGEVQPCPYLPIAAGDVHDQPFSAIWQGAPIFERLRAGALTGSCGRCKWGKQCFGCRARAYWASGGDYLAGDPWCVRHRQPAGEGA